MGPVVGDWLNVHGRVLGTSDQTSEIFETPGTGGEREARVSCSRRVGGAPSGPPAHRNTVG